MEFSSTLKTLRFEPYGQLFATLPLDATFNGLTQKLSIKFQDEHLFDTQKLLVKVDFPVCPVMSIVDGLLGKLGSLSFSPQSIMGPVGFSGIEFGDVLDDFFPDVGQFIDGILESEFLPEVLCVLLRRDSQLPHSCHVQRPNTSLTCVGKILMQAFFRKFFLLQYLLSFSCDPYWICLCHAMI
jgi:hypothetical protein